MNPSYKKEKNKDYMILESPGKPEGSEYPIRMLQLNHIPGLLECRMRKIDTVPEFCYDITESCPMTRAYEKHLMGKQDIERLFRSLETAMDESERFLLELEQFVLRPDYIFRSGETGQFSFCYLPFYDGSLEADFRELAEFILKRLDHSQEEAVLWGYDIYSRSVEEHFSMGRILEGVHERAVREEVKSLEEQTDIQEPEYEEYTEIEENRAVCEGRLPSHKEKAPEPVKQDNSMCKETRGRHIPVNEKKDSRNRKEYPQRPKRSKKSFHIRSVQTRAELRGRSGQAAAVLLGMIGSMAVAVWAVWYQGLNLVQAGGILVLCMGLLVYFTMVFQKKPRKEAFGEEIAQWEISEDNNDQTVFLGKPLPEDDPVLVSMNPNKQGNIVLDKNSLTLGKQKEQVDIFLAEPSVSRIHASIEKEADGWYVRDCDSTNGTYVAGKRLAGGGRHRLEDGEEISFAEVRFYFHCR